MKNQMLLLFKIHLFIFIILINILAIFLFWGAIRINLNIIHPVLASLLIMFLFYPLIYLGWFFNSDKIIKEVNIVNNKLKFLMLNNKEIEISIKDINKIKETYLFTRNKLEIKTKETDYIFFYISNNVIALLNIHKKH